MSPNGLHAAPPQSGFDISDRGISWRPGGNCLLAEQGRPARVRDLERPVPPAFSTARATILERQGGFSAGLKKYGNGSRWMCFEDGNFMKHQSRTHKGGGFLGVFPPRASRII